MTIEEKQIVTYKAYLMQNLINFLLRLHSVMVATRIRKCVKKVFQLEKRIRIHRVYSEQAIGSVVKFKTPFSEILKIE